MSNLWQMCEYILGVVLVFPCSTVLFTVCLYIYVRSLLGNRGMLNTLFSDALYSYIQHVHILKHTHKHAHIKIKLFGLCKIYIIIFFKYKAKLFASEIFLKYKMHL